MYRISTIDYTEHQCDFINNCNFKQPDCKSIGTDIIFNSNEAYIKFTNGNTEQVSLSYTCEAPWNHMSFSGNLNFIDSSKSFEVNNVEFLTQNIEIHKTVTIHGNVTFQQPDNEATTISRKIDAIIFTDKSGLIVKNSNGIISPSNDQNATSNYLLFTALISGKIPENINAIGCDNDYYFKTTLSTCVCILSGNSLENDTTKTIFENDGDRKCLNSIIQNGVKPNLRYALEIKESSVEIKTSGYIFRSLKLEKESVTFTCSINNCQLTIEDFGPIKNVFIGNNVELIVDSFSSLDTTTIIRIDSPSSKITVPSNFSLDNLYIPIIAQSNTLFNKNLGDDKSFKLNINNVESTYYRYYKNTNDLVCSDETNQGKDCYVDTYSEHYQYICPCVNKDTQSQRKYCQVNSNYKSIVTNQDKCLVKSTSPRTIGSFNAQFEVEFDSNIQIQSFTTDGTKLVLFNEKYPRLTTNTKQQKYSYSLKSSNATTNENNLKKCGNLESKYYRYGNDCSCEDSDDENMLPDCQKPEYQVLLNYTISKSDAKIKYNWFRIVDSNSNDLQVEFQVTGNNHFVLKKDHITKITTTVSSPTITLEYPKFETSEKIPFIHIGSNVKISSIVNIPQIISSLFVSVDDQGEIIASRSHCQEKIYRYFTTPTAKTQIGCNCQGTYSNEKEDFDFKDCYHNDISQNYDLIINANYKLATQWNSLTIANGQSLTIADSAKVNKITVKSESDAYDIQYNSIVQSEIVPNRNKYLTISFSDSIQTTNSFVSINKVGENEYYASTKKPEFITTTLTKDKCEEEFTRIHNGIGCYCSIVGNTYSGVTSLNYPDCKHYTGAEIPYTLKVLSNQNSITFNGGVVNFNSLFIDNTNDITFNNQHADQIVKFGKII